MPVQQLPPAAVQPHQPQQGPSAQKPPPPGGETAKSGHGHAAAPAPPSRMALLAATGMPPPLPRLPRENTSAPAPRPLTRRNGGAVHARHQLHRPAQQRRGEVAQQRLVLTAHKGHVLLPRPHACKGHAKRGVAGAVCSNPNHSPRCMCLFCRTGVWVHAIRIVHRLSGCCGQYVHPNILPGGGNLSRWTRLTQVAQAEGGPSYEL